MTGDETFRLSVPRSWFELPLTPRTRDAAIRVLVEERMRQVPELREHRGEIVKLLRRQARDAWEAGAVYAACFAMVVDDLLIPGSLTVSVLPPPPGTRVLDALLEALPSQDAADDGEPWQTRGVVTLANGIQGARSQGVRDVGLSGGGAARVIVMQTFVPVDAERVLLVAAASPALDLTEPLLELFDAVSGTLTLSESADRRT